MNRIGDRIRELRLAKGLIGRELADIVGVAKETICKWETGRYIPSLFYIPLLAHALDSTYEYLLYGDCISLDQILADKTIKNVAIARHADAFYIQIDCVDGLSVKLTDKILYKLPNEKNYKEIIL